MASSKGFLYVCLASFHQVVLFVNLLYLECCFVLSFSFFNILKRMLSSLNFLFSFSSQSCCILALTCCDIKPFSAPCADFLMCHDLVSWLCWVLFLCSLESHCCLTRTLLNSLTDTLLSWESVAGELLCCSQVSCYLVSLGFLSLSTERCTAAEQITSTTTKVALVVLNPKAMA